VGALLCCVVLLDGENWVYLSIYLSICLPACLPVYVWVEIWVVLLLYCLIVLKRHPERPLA
jgi:hypothetical protein